MTKRRLAYLGPPGTFGEEAALRCDPDAEHLPFPSHAAVAGAVESGMADAGVIAIENSLSGSVAETLDILIHDTALQIERELVLPIEHNLIGRPGTRPDHIQFIYSHPQVFGQCRRFLERCFPRAQHEAALSTVEAVQFALAREEGDAAAIGTLRAAELAGGEVLAHGIQDAENNVTRFLVLGHESTRPSGRDRTSIAFTLPEDRPGALAAVLDLFAERGMNLTKIESRPTREVFGEYVFLIDFEGHRDEPEVRAVLEQLTQLTDTLKVFGSYPRWK